jgi:hypothetical protein
MQPLPGADSDSSGLVDRRDDPSYHGRIMLDTVLKEYFENGRAFSTDTAEVYCRIIGRGKGLFRPKMEANALIVMKSDEINFHQIADALLKNLRPVDSEKKTGVTCRWIVCSDRGGIYLFEAIATKDNITYKNLKSRFVVLNSLDGTVSFGPGHILNGRYSDRMREMIESSRTQNRAKWTMDFQALVGQIYQA